MAAARQLLKLKDVSIGASKLISHCKSFKFSDLEVTLASPEILTPKPDVDRLEFGKFFSDHMLKAEYCVDKHGWQKPKIRPMETINLHPAAKVLHYAVELFEGMKAYRGVDGRVRLFRPDMNMARMNKSAMRSGLPTFDSEELIKCICRLVQIEQEWVPHSETASLYLRPTLIGIDPMLGVTASESALLYVICCPVGSYFKGGASSVSVMADPKYTRAWYGGVGDRKMGANYAPTVLIQKEAKEKGCDQVLWLYGEEDQVTEAGTMNIFVVLKSELGETELITPPLDGLILPGVTRASILDLAQREGSCKISERTITMGEIQRSLSKGRLLEMFGAGTACVVSPISSVLYKDRLLQIPTMLQPEHSRQCAKFQRALYRIQYGYEEHPWGVCVDDCVQS